MSKILLKMYLNKNLGDDLFLKMIAERYSWVKFYVRASRKYCKIFGLKNVQGRTLVRRVVDKIKKDMLKRSICNGKYEAEVVLGGSMFIEGNNATEASLQRDMLEQYNSSVPIYIMGVNFGPYHSQFYYSEHRKLFLRAKDVCFRDSYSADLFGDLANVRMAPDIIFGLNPGEYATSQAKRVVISVINLAGRKNIEGYLDIYERKIAEIAGMYALCGYEVVLMSFCKEEGDEEAIRRVMAKTDNGNIRPYFYRGNINEALKQISSSEIVIGTRFHSVILGLVFEKKVLPIIYSEKTKNALSDIGFGGKMIEMTEMAQLKAKDVDSLLSKYGDVTKLRKASEAHFRMLDELLVKKGKYVKA